MDRRLEARWARVCARAAARGRSARRSRRLPDGLRIERGTREDLRAFAPFHYRAGPPATCVRVLRVVDTRAGCLAGVLAVSMPTWWGPARRRAWPGVFDSGDMARDAAAVNRELRTISRVVVDPRYRGLGLATRLVERYLAAPLTPRTEAIAAMGEYCPFFAAAGMREVAAPPHARDRRLARALEMARVEVWRLLDPVRAAALVKERRDVSDALRAWARAARPPRRLATARAAAIAPHAASALLARPRAYVAESKRRIVSRE